MNKFKNLQQYDLTKGNILKSLLIVALPIMLSNFLQTLYNITDAFFLGKLGRAEISAPTISFNIIFFLIIFGMGLSMAGTTLIAQSKGKKDQEKVDFYLGQTTFLLFSGAIIIAIIGILLTPFLLRILQTPDDVFVFAKDYMTIVLAGLPFMFGMFILSSSLQGIGDTITPLKIQFFTVSLNIILDPILIFGIWIFPRLGVKGAAIATVFARMISTIIALNILIKGKKGLKLKKENLKPDKNAILLFLKIGLPASIGQGLSALGFTVLQGIVNSFGTAVVAAFGVGNRIISLFNMPAMGLSRATVTLMGQNLGAKNIKRAKKAVNIAVWADLAFLIPAMTFTFFFGNSFVKFFVNDPETIKWGAMLFKIVSPSVVFFGVFTIITGAFQGAGDTKPVMFLNIGRLWGIRVPLAYVLAVIVLKDPLGIWFAMFASNLLISLIGIYWFSRGKWIHAIDIDKI